MLHWVKICRVLREVFGEYTRVIRFGTEDAGIIETTTLE